MKADTACKRSTIWKITPKTKQCKSFWKSGNNQEQKTGKKCARGKDPGPLALKKMIEGGYAYVDIAAATGLGMTAVRAKTKKYGLRELYHKTHPNVRRFDVKVLCTNRLTGEQREYKTMSAAERALGLYHCALSQNTKNGKAFVHGNWEFKRAN